MMTIKDDPMTGYVARLDEQVTHPPNDYRNARGALNWDDWNEPAEVSIRRLRNGGNETYKQSKEG